MNGIENGQRPWKFLAATNFCNEPSDIFAASFPYHGNCLNKYILQASCELEKISRYNTKADDAIHDKQGVDKVFEEFCPEMDLSCRGYTLLSAVKR